jgi:23S rRNA (uracil1939-C5)-methyltransferase
MTSTSRLVTLDIKGLDPGEDGAGYATLDGRRVLIDGVLPDERVEVRVTGGRRGVRSGSVARVVRASPQRVVPGCRHFGPCGGCTLQHIAYAEQLTLKTEYVRALLRDSLGGRAPAVEPMLPTSPPWGYRDKVHFVFASSTTRSDLVMGHYRRRSQAVVGVEECPVHAPAGNETAFAIRDALRAAGVGAAAPGMRHGVARHVVVRVAEAAGERLATLVVTRNDKALRPAVRKVLDGVAAPTGFHLNIHERPDAYLFGPCTRKLGGAERIRESVGGTAFLVSPTAFFQTNLRAAGEMVRLVLEHAKPARSALDLYAGVGLFALPLAARGVRVMAVEETAGAVEDGEASRRLNGIPESACRFVRGRAEDLARGRLRRGVSGPPDLVVVDPPRTGCPAVVLGWLSRELRPCRIIYVSCNPQALARDLRALAGARYVAALVQPIDMFPHTAHIETVAVLAHGSS